MCRCNVESVDELWESDKALAEQMNNALYWYREAQRLRAECEGLRKLLPAALTAEGERMGAYRPVVTQYESLPPSGLSEGDKEGGA